MTKVVYYLGHITGQKVFIKFNMYFNPFIKVKFAN